MPIINKGNGTKRSRDRTENGQRTDVTNWSRVTSTQLTSRSAKKKKYTQNMCVYIKIASHFRLSIESVECLEIKNKCPQRNSNYEVKSFKQVRIEKYITPLAGSILTNRSRVWPVNFFYQHFYKGQRLSTNCQHCGQMSYFSWNFIGLSHFCGLGVEMKNLQRSGQAHFIRASSPDSAPPNRLAIWYSLFAARACAPKCEPARRLWLHCVYYYK